MTHCQHMDEALGLAFGAMGRTSPNPAVGALIVRDGEVVARGRTSPCGGDHAEAEAIKAAGPRARGAEMYVTLEPCCHQGLTPPCTGAIIGAGISRVYMPILDPNPLVSGKGALALRNAGVAVEMLGERAGAATDLIRPFRKLILRKRPFIILKLALTLDGRTATPTGDSRWISNEHSRYLAHRLRSLCDAVIIGKHTLEIDNPSLTVRLDEFPEGTDRPFRLDEFTLSGYDNYLIRRLLGPGEGLFDRREPLRVVMGLPERPDRNGNFFATDNYLVIEDEARRAELLRGAGGKSIEGDVEAGRMVFLPGRSPAERVAAAQAELARRGLMTCMLEGGSTLAGSYFDAGEIDQFLFIIAPKLVGGGRPALSGEGRGLMREALELRDVTTADIRGDLLMGGYRERYQFEMI